MTIATKTTDVPEKQKEKCAESLPELVEDLEEGDEEQKFFSTLYKVYVVRQRRRLFTTLCIGLLGLWFLVVAIIGSVLLYRYVHRKPIIHGVVGTDVQGQRLEENLSIIEYRYMRIDVPQFGYNRPGIFIHDFKQNLTAIVDLRGRQCFIKPLDRGILPPKNLIDLFTKMQDGYYEQDTTVIEEHYLARDPDLSTQELASLGSSVIRDECERFRSYWLERLTGLDARQKREVCGATPQSQLDYVEFVPQQAVYRFKIELPCVK